MASGRLRGLLAKAFRIFESPVWNSNGRAEAKELQDTLGAAYLGDAPAAFDSCVLGGLACSGVPTTLDTIVAPGTAFIHDAAIPPLDSKYAFTSLEVATTVTHDAADVTDPRIDIVYIVSVKGDAPGATADVKIHPLDGGGVDVGLAVQEGNIPTLAILKGAAAPTPVAPSVAALDGIPLFAVFVPANETDAANFSYADRRPQRQLRGLPADVPIDFRGAPRSGGFFDLAPGDYKHVVGGQAILARLFANARASVVLGWDDNEALPFWFRDTSDLVDRGLGGDIYPLTQANGPSHITSYPIRIGFDEHIEDPGDDYDWDSSGYGLRVEANNNVDNTPVGNFPVYASDRGVKLTRAFLTYEIAVAFTNGEARVRLIHWDESAETLINLIDTVVHATGFQILVDVGPGDRTTVELDLDAALLPDVFPVGDFVVLEITVEFDNDNTTQVFFHTLRLEWTDGRA